MPTTAVNSNLYLYCDQQPVTLVDPSGLALACFCASGSNCPEPLEPNCPDTGDTACDRGNLWSIVCPDHNRPPPPPGQWPNDKQWQKYIVPCIVAHEATHRKDKGPCCKLYGDCIANATTEKEKQACDKTYGGWTDDDRVKNWTECNAWTTAVQCLGQELKTACSALGDKFMCSFIQSVAMPIWSAKAESYCSKTKKGHPPCPFGQKKHHRLRHP